jgi:membrane protein DedA with SNARE-associated domain
VFAETGLLIGFFLPGRYAPDHCGLVASQGKLEIWILIPIILAAAIAGDAAGLNRQPDGPRLFHRDGPAS